MSNRPDPFARRLAERLALVAVLLAAGGCHRAPADSSPPEAQAASPPLTVAIVHPQRTTLHREVSQPGHSEAFEETPIFAKVAGYVAKWNVDRGDRVSKGQVLAQLAVPELEEELRQKEALIEQSDAQIEQARKAAAAAEAAFHRAAAGVKEAEASRERAVAERKRSRSQYDRLTRAGQGGAIERESIEEARLAAESAEAGLRQAEARIQTAQAQRDENRAHWDKARADVQVAQSNRKVAGKNRDMVKAQVQYLRLTAPYDGIVTERHVNTGDFVQAATAGTGKPLYTVRRTDLLRIIVQVPETDADWISKGVSARLRIQAETLTGEVARTSWSLEQTTRTLRAEIDLQNPEGRLRPGTYVYATLTAELSDVLTLPRSAVRTEGEVTRGYATYCYQVENGKVRRLLIELGPGDATRIEVRKKQTREGGPWEPFTTDEAIVQGNLAEVRPGQTVTVRKN
jgi:RND family efflux transporter MFP subunit